MHAEVLENKPWPLAARVAFRFVCAYLVLYNLPFPLSELGGFAWAQHGYDALWNAVVPWFGERVLGTPPITVQPNGSGDTTFNYVQVVAYAALASLATIVWSLLDRARADYRVLHDWLRVYVRFMLAATLWGYGMHKVVPLQFGELGGERLLATYGDSSPMGLVWTFMAASPAYTIFSGALEVLAGSLLFFRRTTTLGALVTIAVMTNVVALNYFYDVPVKLYSSHLLLQAVFLLVPERARLVGFFVRNQSVAGAELGPPRGPRWLAHARRAAWCVFVGWTAYTHVAESLAARREYGSLAPKPALYGVWQVERFVCDGAECPLVVGQPKLWRQIAFNSWGGCTIRTTDDRRERLFSKLDEERRSLELTTRDEAARTFHLALERPDPTRAVLTGPFDGRELRVELRALDESDFLLTSRGFRWINEYPFNR